MMRTGYGGMCVGYGNNSVENARADFEEQEAMGEGRVEFDMPRSVSRSRFASVVGTLLKRTVRDKRNTISVEYFSSMTRPLRVTVFGDDVWGVVGRPHGSCMSGVAVLLRRRATRIQRL